MLQRFAKFWETLDFEERVIAILVVIGFIAIIGSLAIIGLRYLIV